MDFPIARNIRSRSSGTALNLRQLPLCFEIPKTATGLNLRFASGTFFDDGDTASFDLGEQGEL